MSLSSDRHAPLAMPAAERPRFYLFGESLGSQVSEELFTGQMTSGPELQVATGRALAGWFAHGEMRGRLTMLESEHSMLTAAASAGLVSGERARSRNPLSVSFR